MRYQPCSTLSTNHTAKERARSRQRKNKEGYDILGLLAFDRSASKMDNPYKIIVCDIGKADPLRRPNHPLIFPLLQDSPFSMARACTDGFTICVQTIN